MNLSRPTLQPLTDGGARETPVEMARPPADADGAADASGDTAVHSAEEPLGNGQPCTHGGQCASTFCVDRVCCASECSAPCHSCRSPGSEGTCLPAPAGADPRDECTEQPAETCLEDGTCDGAGACRRRVAGSQCAAGSCTEATEQAASTCDGAGTCRPGASKSCAPGTCQGGSCGSACSADDQCAAGFYCADNACRPTLGLGNPCPRGAACTSGHCVEGYCCNNACTGTCQTCNSATARGTCSPAALGSDPHGQCAATAANSCGTTGVCDGQGACQLHNAGTACGASAGCSGDQETSAQTCNGLGACLAATTRACSPYRCAGAACATSCSDTTHCQPGFTCSGTACVPATQPDAGAPPSGALVLDDFSDSNLRSNSYGGVVTWDNANVSLVGGEQRFVWNGSGVFSDLIETFKSNWCEQDLTPYATLRFRMRASAASKRVIVYIGMGNGSCSLASVTRLTTITVGTTMTTFDVDLSRTTRNRARTVEFAPSTNDSTEYFVDDIMLLR